MSLKANNVEITKVIFNGSEVNALNFNGTGYFGKRFSLTQSSSTGVSFTISRTSSPNQQAATGSISTGNTIYYGDVITISVSAAAGYADPKLFVNVGDGQGIQQRTSPFTLTVGNNVSFYGSATLQENWQTVWSGSQVFTAAGSFTVPGLAADGVVQISASVEFCHYVYDPFLSNEESGTNTQTVSNAMLPVSVFNDNFYVRFTRNGSQISFQFMPYEMEYKGYVIYIAPTKVTITQVRWQG